MANPIVTVTVSQQSAPAPALLQKTGALISQGATSTSVGTRTLLTQKSDLTAILAGAKALTSLTWSGSVVTGTTTSPHGWTTSDTFPVTIAGAAPTGYNGTFIATVTGASTFTYPLASNPGSETTPGTVTTEDVAELTAMVNTFFAQGGAQGVYVLELGTGNAADGVAFLSSWIGANPSVFYSYLVPRYWDGDSTYLTFLAGFEALNSKTYFWTTTTLATYADYTPAMKCVLAMIEAPAYGKWAQNTLSAISYSTGVVTGTTTTAHGVSPGQWFTIAGCTPSGYNGTWLALAGTTGSTLKYAVPADPGAESVLGHLAASLYTSAGVPSTEFSLAAPFQVALSYKPSSTNKVAPLNQAFLFGVTAFPQDGNNTLLQTLNTAGVNVVGTGAAGGISATILVGGKTMDLNPFNYWYSVDWTQIMVPRAMNAALINARNSPAPIYYNQDGINALQQVGVTTMTTGISAGLVLNPIKASTLDGEDIADAINADTFGAFTLINADPFASYVDENPDDYAAGAYNGFLISYTPLRGFENVTVAINVSNFAT